jgi:hypothetical protein
MGKPILLVHKSICDTYTMYQHEVLKAHDAPEFKKPMLNEIEQHIKRNN